MIPPWPVVWAGIVAAAMILFATVFWPADAQEADHKQMYHADPHYDAWFRSLKIPGTDTSCCSLRDCDRTEAEWRADGWYALVRGIWRAIPPAKVVKTPTTIDGEAYVCANPAGPPESAGIFCFIPPVPGY